MTMPNPEGCFVQVWDQPQHKGISDFLNGPRALMSLQDLPGRRAWKDRIRSFQTGMTARVTVYVEEDLRGQGVRVLPDTAYPMLSDWMSRGIKSMNIDCERAALPSVERRRRSSQIRESIADPGLSEDVSGR
jgi:hypothetical protein